MMNVNIRINNFILAAYRRLALGVSGRYIFLLFCFMCMVAWQQVFAQTSAPASMNQEPKALIIGDEIPEELWNLPLQVVNHPGGKETITLGDYKNKLIILDFWATWCAPCIKSLHKLDVLQQEFSDDIVVIPISSEDAGRVLPFLKKQGWKLPSVLEKDVLAKYFPFNSVPLQVWLSQGKLLAFPESEYAGSNIITSVLQGNKPEMIMKEEEASFDPTEILKTDQQTYVESGIRKRANVESSGFRIMHNGLVYYNASFLQLVQESFRRTHPFIMDKKRIIFELTDSTESKLFPPNDQLTGDYQADQLFLKWRENYTYTYYNKYDRSVTRDVIYNRFRSDITSFFLERLGLYLSFKQIPVECLVIRNSGKRSQTTNKPGTTYTYSLENKPFATFINNLRIHNENIPTPIIDETGFEDRITLHIKSPLNNLQQLKEELLQYGFQLTKEVVDIPMLIISDKPVN